MEILRATIIEPKLIQNWIQALTEEEKIFTATKELKNGEFKVLPMAQLVEDIVLRDSENTKVDPNAWLLYSAFNEVIHGKMQGIYRDQKRMDENAFNGLVNLAQFGSRELVLS